MTPGTCGAGAMSALAALRRSSVTRIARRRKQPSVLLRGAIPAWPHMGLPSTKAPANRSNVSSAWLGQTSYTVSMSIVRNIAGIAKGMSITFREMLQPTEVENYPDGPGPTRGAVLQERFRGAHVLQRDENGLEKCVACYLCAAACPSNCIYIEAAENTAENRISSAERYAKVYNIDYNRCIFCGYCVEACPTDAITHGHGFELAIVERHQPGHAQRRHAGAGRRNAGRTCCPLGLFEIAAGMIT